MYCTHCGKKIPDGVSFCPYCGQPTGLTPADTNEREELRDDAYIPDESDEGGGDYGNNPPEEEDPYSDWSADMGEDPIPSGSHRSKIPAVIICAAAAVVVGGILLFGPNLRNVRWKSDGETIENNTENITERDTSEAAEPFESAAEEESETQPVSETESQTVTEAANQPDQTTAGTEAQIQQTETSVLQSQPVQTTSGAQPADNAAAEGSDYILPDSNDRLLTDADIGSLTAQQVNYAKNEIYARHGRRFRSQELQNYFDSKSWYTGTVDPDSFSESLLSDIEKKNVELLAAREDELSAGGYALDQNADAGNGGSTAVNTSSDPSSDSSGWKQAYISYINEQNNMYPAAYYSLINVNNDSIPELFSYRLQSGGGDILCTYHNGELSELSMWGSGFSYIEGENIFRHSGGLHSSFEDEIYAIDENGQFVLQVSGSYSIYDAAGNVQTDSAGMGIYHYEWNGEEVSSETEYMNLLNEAFDTQRAVTPSNGVEFDPDTSSYTTDPGENLYHSDEMIDIINQY